MRRTHPSLFHLAGYLPPAGLLLLTAPEFTRNLLLSNRDCDDAPFRHVGILPVILAIVLIGIPPTACAYVTDRRRPAVAQDRWVFGALFGVFPGGNPDAKESEQLKQ